MISEALKRSAATKREKKKRNIEKKGTQSTTIDETSAQRGKQMSK